MITTPVDCPRDSLVSMIAGLQTAFLSANSKLFKSLDICIKLYSYSRIGTNETNMKIRVWTVLWTIIRKARNHCQGVDNCRDDDHCRYHLGIDCQIGNHCQDGNEHADR